SVPKKNTKAAKIAALQKEKPLPALLLRTPASALLPRWRCGLVLCILASRRGRIKGGGGAGGTTAAPGMTASAQRRGRGIRHRKRQRLLPARGCAAYSLWRF